MLTVECIGGQEIVYFWVAGYNKLIWDVLVPEGEWEEAG